jgi:hypothetical protein
MKNLLKQKTAHNRSYTASPLQCSGWLSRSVCGLTPTPVFTHILAGLQTYGFGYPPCQIVIYTAGRFLVNSAFYKYLMGDGGVPRAKTGFFGKLSLAKTSAGGVYFRLFRICQETAWRFCHWACSPTGWPSANPAEVDQAPS